MENKLICEANDCMGCGVCSVICPEHCINMTENEHGFRQPVADSAKCILCRLCEKICPIHQVWRNTQTQLPACYAAWNKDDDVRLQSSSGGVFSAFAQQIIHRGGIVYGAVIHCPPLELRHQGTDHIEGLAAMRGSKYFQSEAYSVFPEVQTALAKGREVLFTGTPCQIAALYNYLREDDEKNLYTIDILCHGVTSRKVIEAYINSMEKKLKRKVKKIDFRVKNDQYGWENSCVMALQTDDGIVIHSDTMEDTFWKGYLENIILRESCYHCRFTGTRRLGDITIADFWGLGKSEDFPYDTRKGVNLLLINSNQGRDLCKRTGSSIYMVERTMAEAKKMNMTLSQPFIKHAKANIFFETLGNKPYDKIIRSYFKWHFLKQDLKALIGRKNVNRVRQILKISRSIKLPVK